MNALKLDNLKDDVIEDYKELIKGFFDYFKNKNLKDLFLYKDDFKNKFIDENESELQDKTWEIADSHTPIYYSDIYSIFNSDPGEIDDAFYNFKREYGSENVGDTLSENIKRTICYILEQELYQFDINNYLDELINEYIEELSEKAKEIDKDFNINNIDEILDKVDIHEKEDFFKIILNNKISRNLEEKAKTKIIKI